MTIYETAEAIGTNLTTTAYHAEYVKNPNELKGEVEDAIADLTCLLAQFDHETETTPE